MSTKKTRKPGKHRADRYSKKRSGIVAMALRVDVRDARLIRRAAKAKKQSTNHWMSTHLLALAQMELQLNLFTPPQQQE